VYLYDDRLRIVYNYTQQGAEPVDFAFVEGLDDADGEVFALDASGSTINTPTHIRAGVFLCCGES
ncbi:MAG: hypothetical protein IJP43_04400, partial [Oscillospiraceae bacterium]|nr:hypothetical protein [Oscillospiraceae bacterium]